MKLTYRQIEPFVKNPDPKARVILIYGPDNGLVKERANTIGKTVVADLNDPFNAISFTASTLSEDPAKLQDEAHAISMMGGNRLIRITQAGDKITSIIKDYLESPSQETLVVVEAGGLGTSSKLRKLCEKEKNAAAVPCYVEDERDLARLIRDTLQAHEMRVEPDAVSFLATSIAGDRAKARGEIEKLISYMMSANDNIVTLEDAQACCGSAGAISLDDLVMNIGSKKAHDALQNYNQLIREGVNFVVILRTMQNHFRKLHVVRSALDNGQSMQDAVKSLRPPLFFKTADAFKAQVRNWSCPALERVSQRLYELEAECKQTGAPVETLCGQAILAMSASRR